MNGDRDVCMAAVAQDFDYTNKDINADLDMAERNKEA